MLNIQMKHILVCEYTNKTPMRELEPIFPNSSLS